MIVSPMAALSLSRRVASASAWNSLSTPLSARRSSSASRRSAEATTAAEASRPRCHPAPGSPPACTAWAGSAENHPRMGRNGADRNAQPPGGRRRDGRRGREIRSAARHGLGDPAADVVPADHRPVQPELVDQPDDTARLCIGVMLAGRIGRVLVGLAEAPQVGHNDIRRRRHQRDDLALVGPVAWPPVQQQHGGTATNPLVCETEPVDGDGLEHPGEYLRNGGRPPGPRRAAAR